MEPGSFCFLERFLRQEIWWGRGQTAWTFGAQTGSGGAIVFAHICLRLVAGGNIPHQQYHLNLEKCR